MEAADRSQFTFSAFLQLERTARHAETADALAFTIVNETRRLVSYRRAVLVDLRGGRPRVAAVSGVSSFEPNAPLLQWTQRLVRHLTASRAPSCDERNVATPVARSSLPEALARDWHEHADGEMLRCDLHGPDGERLGVLILSRVDAWTEADRVLMERLCDAFGHAWWALLRKPAAARPRLRWIAAVALACFVGLMAFPVPQSALAPATVVAADAEVIAAPMDGVVQRVFVEPNMPVEAGAALFRFDDTVPASRLEIAARTLQVAEAELQRARQGAFESRERSAQIAALEAQVALRRTELAYARQVMGFVVVDAERAGIAIFSSANDWIGRPVATGERVMQIADPAAVKLRIDLAVADAIVLDDRAAVELFLDVAPLDKRRATVTSASYEADVTADGILAYRVDAQFSDGRPPPRIGLRGTAKISGADTPLALYLFRRPISAVRQWAGL